MWVVDSTPVECARSRETAHRSELAGWAEYGYCASHSRYFWGLRLHLLCTLHGLPVGFAVTGAKADERQMLLGHPRRRPRPDRRPSRADGDRRQALLRPRVRDHPRRPRHRRCCARPATANTAGPAARFFKPLRQVIESINDTFKGQLDLEHHGGHTPAGVWVRVLQRVLALTAAIWHNDHIGQPSHDH